MNFEIKFMPEAEESYTAIAAQIIERWGERTLIKLEAKIRKSLNTLSTSPYLYPIANEFTELRKCLLHKNCSMIYKIDGDKIVIVCFWDNRQEPMF
jgi:plasmid stabilization system protein ParE